MLKFTLIKKSLFKILSIFIIFLTWFIRLDIFIGDVTIFLIKTILLSIGRLLKKGNLDFKKKAPAVFHAFDRLIHNPIIGQDRSFKVGLATIFILIFAIWFTTRDLPSPKQLETRKLPQTTKIYDRDGELLYNIYSDQNRTVVPLSEIPNSLKQATIAIEDKDFYKHKGFDIYGIARATRKTVFEGNLQGGSTITQQLVKSAFLSPERTISRKIKELYLAFRVEMAFPKDRILEMYLNQVPYGGTAWGAAAAAEQYFGKDVKDLTLAQSALLAGLPAAPTYYSPFGQDSKRAFERQKVVLARMVDDHSISKEEATRAQSEEIQIRPAIINIKAPHFVMYVREYLAQKYGETVAAQGGLKVTTTLDLVIQ